jgi:hypothetical protein
MNSETKRYIWHCPACGKGYRVKAGYRPRYCPKCRQTYTQAEMPPRPEWLQEHAEKKAAFRPAHSLREFHEPEPGPLSMSVGVSDSPRSFIVSKMVYASASE